MIETINKSNISELPVIFSGISVASFPRPMLEAITFDVSYSLSTHSYTMLQYTPDQLMKRVLNGQGIVALNPKGDFLGFAQVWSLGVDQRSGRELLEGGSLISKVEGVGIGSELMKECSYLGRILNPKAVVVGIVEETNLPAQRVMRKIGGIELSGKPSPVLRTMTGEQAWMKVFDITAIQERR